MKTELRESKLTKITYHCGDKVHRIRRQLKDDCLYVLESKDCLSTETVSLPEKNIEGCSFIK